MKKLNVTEINATEVQDEDMIKCECGCGQTFCRLDAYGRPRHFLNGHNCRGKTLSKEHRRKISEANKGKIFTELHRQRLSEAHTGHIHSEEQKRKISESLIGNKRRLGIKHTKETKEKMSKAQKRRQRRLRGD